MIDLTELYGHLYTELEARGFGLWRNKLPDLLDQAFSNKKHGDFLKWRNIVDALPAIVPSRVDLTASAVEIGGPGDCGAATKKEIEGLLRGLHPWRKGPYSIHGIHIDAEWRSDWKWDRLIDHIQPLAGRTVLDVGCGNGYHCWRAAGAGAGLTVGVDPTLLSVMQFHAVRRLAGEQQVYVLPLGIEDISPRVPLFDTVFSMGVLYHRRSPLDHLFELRDLLRPGGELILETLIITGKVGEVLLPPGRYARMRNVWFIPSVETLAAWLERCGFKKVRAVDVASTATEEQRGTDWMRFQSLADCLNSENPKLTVEGLPAPTRAILLAEKP